ncbi:hypothetical protein DIS24_g11603 [Lasiodiplodia hormozganensis]|uniref:Uncharacterized protein n=1 Tax=Lasiodiplodia hormozganensis TaxID=869390 RepID=A0AA39WNK1_9PEZI|nr:hypothetical protein DIS24_g11603 [Lasiodiplodia hormozganensis]
MALAMATTLVPLLPANWTLSAWTLALAVALSLPLLLYFQKRRAAKPEPFFNFTGLPAEIRNMVYEEMVDPDCNPSFPTEAMRAPRPLSMASWIPHRKKPNYPKYGILLASRQLHREFMDVLCKSATFTLNVDRSNEQSANLWPLSRDSVTKVRSCEIRIIATSNMLGSRDPRSMPRDWGLRDRVSRSLSAMKRVEKLRLHVHAVPDRMWNPLWLWSQVSQQFKDLAEPRFTAITFGLESWTLGENCLKRDADGRWKWTCPANHVVTDDPEGWQPIREFCAALYLECRECQQQRAESAGTA